MELRKAAPADAEKIADLLGQLGYPSGVELVRENILTLSARPDAEVTVAVDDEGVAGFISIHFIPQIAFADPFARICYFCVHEKNQGRGIGKLLESHCVRAAKERGCDRIELHCHSRRTEAHRFYGARGYRESPKYFVKMLRGRP